MTTCTDPLFHVTWTRRLAVASILALIILCFVWEMWLAPLRPGGSWLALKALPLLIPLPGLLRNRMYTYRWVSLIIWLYFIEGVVRAYGDSWPSNALAGLEVIFCLSLFFACAMHVRLRFQQATLMNTEEKPQPEIHHA